VTDLPPLDAWRGPAAVLTAAEAAHAAELAATLPTPPDPEAEEDS